MNKTALPGKSQGGRLICRFLIQIALYFRLIDQIGKALKRSIVGLFDIVGKAAAGQLAILQMFAQADAAGALGRTTGIAASAMGEVGFFLRAVHVDSLTEGEAFGP